MLFLQFCITFAHTLLSFSDKIKNMNKTLVSGEKKEIIPYLQAISQSDQ